jgi:hypothetical protein
VARAQGAALDNAVCTTSAAAGAAVSVEVLCGRELVSKEGTARAVAFRLSILEIADLRASADEVRERAHWKRSSGPSSCIGESGVERLHTHNALGNCARLRRWPPCCPQKCAEGYWPRLSACKRPPQRFPLDLQNATDLSVTSDSATAKRAYKCNTPEYAGNSLPRI